MNRISIFKDKIDLNEYYGKYLEYIQQTSSRDSFRNHFQAAFYAPVLFLKGVTEFEGTFDKILMHLEVAYSKATNEKSQRGVQISMQWLLDFHIDVIETWIDVAESRSAADWHLKLWESIQRTAKELVDYFTGEPNEIVITAEVGKLFNEYYVHLTNKKTIKKYKNKFYPQLLDVYSKVLNSKIYSSDHQLVVNTFLRVKDKQQMLTYALRKKGLAITLNMLRQFDMPKDSLGHTLAVLIRNLDKQKTDDNDLKKIMGFAIEHKLINQDEIKRDLIDFYKQAFKPKEPSISLPVLISILVSLFIYVGLVVQGVNITKESADNFWTTAGKYILAIGSSLLSSLYITCALLAVAVGSAVIVRSVISNRRENNFHRKGREFENELDGISK